MELSATGTVRKGRLEIRGRANFAAGLRRMRDGEVVVTVSRRKVTRSQQQNAWYWGVIVELLSDHTGYTPDEVHELLKAKFLPKRLAVMDGNGRVQGEFVIGGTTTKLDKLAFGEYCEAVRRWAAEALSVVIPDPQEM